MKLLRQFLWIVVFTFAGEVLHALLPLPVAAALLCCLYVLWTILIASSLKDFIIIAGIIGFGLALNHLRGRQTAPLATPSIEGE